MLKISALTGDGLDDLAERLISAASSGAFRAKRNDLSRVRAEARSLLRTQAERAIQERTSHIQSLQDFAQLFD